MSKKIIGLLLALCLVVGLLPAITAQAEEASEETTTGATTSTVTLWGVEFTVDTDDATADIPAALYWTNNASREEAPQASDASNWNYSFTIVDGVPTVTLRNVTYTYGTKLSNFLKATLEGSDKLEVKYEGENTFALATGTTTAKYTTARLFNINCASSDASFSIIGAENAVLTTTVAYNVYIINVPYATLTIKGGTLNYTRGNVGHNGFISANNGRLNIEDCTINCTSITEGTSTYPVIVGGGKTTIDNSKINIDTIGCAILGGTFNSAHSVADHEKYARDVIITGNSEVKINAQSTGTKVYSGTGIFARSLSIQGGTVEIAASRAALAAGGTSTTELVAMTPDMAAYNGSYVMYTAEGGEAVTQYTTTTYFKVAAPGASAPTTEPTTEPTTAPTTAPTTEPTTAPTTEPTTAPTTEPTVAPTTEATQAPTTEATQAPTQGNENPSTGDNGIVMFTTLLFVAMFGIVATVAFGKKHA